MEKHRKLASTKSLLSVTSSLEGSKTNVKRGLLFVECLKGDEPVCCFCEIGLRHVDDPDQYSHSGRAHVHAAACVHASLASQPS
jgi:hypothetical protein